MSSKYATDELITEPRRALDKFLDFQWFKTSNIFDANMTGKGGMIFRGQSDATWKLCPSAFRQKAFEKYVAQTPAEGGSGLASLGMQLHAEARSIMLFLQAADEVGITNPIDYTTTKDGMDLVEAALNNRDFDYDVEYPPRSFQRATALAQHHGVPTRYMDWSESPLVALYFAALSASSISEEKIEVDREIAVYFLSTDQINKDSSPIGLVRAPRHESSHLLQQVGVFTTFKKANQYFISEGRWPCIEDYVTPKFQVHRIRLPATAADETLRMLYDLGVTRHSLMPTLDNAAKSFSYARALWPTGSF